jgi:hypothetical protein
MKTIISIGVAAVLISGLMYHSNASTVNPNEYYLVLKFSETGNALALADKFQSYDDCITSADYKLHDAVGRVSGSNIQCVNDLPKYR